MSNFSVKGLSVLLTFPLLAPLAHAETDQETRIKMLETQLKNQQRKISVLEQNAAPTKQASATFNPDISLILSGQYVNFSSDQAPSHDALLNGEEELLAPGFNVGHSELVLSANADDRFYGQFTIAFAEHEGETETEIEEAFVQTTLFQGMKAKGGRFLSGFGYHNEFHEHAWDISSGPLAYRYFLAGGLRDDGFQFNYLLPTETYVLMGAELLKGQHYPATANTDLGAWTAYVNIGGDLSDKASWLLGVSHYDGKAEERSLDAGHEGEDASEEAHSAFFDGDVQVSGLEAVFKYAPTGNMKQQQIKLQAEYLWADDDGELTLIEPDAGAEITDYQADKKGFYVQGSYHWSPQWYAALRYDEIDGDLEGDEEILAETGLKSPWNPDQTSLSLNWVPSEFSRVRVQYTHEYTGDEGQDAGDLWLVDYTVSLGAHGAHRY